MRGESKCERERECEREILLNESIVVALVLLILSSCPWSSKKTINFWEKILEKIFEHHLCSLKVVLKDVALFLKVVCFVIRKICNLHSFDPVKFAH